MVARVLFPQVKWAQRKENVFITVEIASHQNMSVDLEEDLLKFHAEGNNDIYEFSLTFPAKIDKEKSKYSCDRVVHILLVKQIPERWPTLATNVSRAHWLKCDWDKWLDTDDEEALSNKGLGGYGDMDFSNFGGMGDLDGGDFPEDDLDNEESECGEDIDLNDEEDKENQKENVNEQEADPHSGSSGTESSVLDPTVKAMA